MILPELTVNNERHLMGIVPGSLGDSSQRTQRAREIETLIQV